MWSATPGCTVSRVIRDSLVRTALVFAASLALGFVALYLAAGDEVFRAETYRIERAGPILLSACVAAFLAEWLMPAVRLQLLCRNQGTGISYTSALLVHLVSVLGAVVTPGNAGGAPTAAVALNRIGVPFGRSVGVMLQVFILDLFFFAWAVPLSLGYLLAFGTVALPPAIEAAGLGMSVLALAGAVVLGRYPRPVVALLLLVSKWPLARRFDGRIRGVARDYYRSSRAYGRTPVPLRVTLNVVTAVHWLAAFVLLWGFLKLYGVDLSLAVTLALLNILTLVSQFVPTPGGAGFVEAAVALGVGSYAAGGSVAGALVLWRLLAFNIIFLVGPFAGGCFICGRAVEPGSPDEEGVSNRGREDRHDLCRYRVQGGEAARRSPPREGRPRDEPRYFLRARGVFRSPQRALQERFEVAAPAVLAGRDPLPQHGLGLLGKSSLHRAGRHDDDLHTPRLELHPQRVGERLQSVLGGRVSPHERRHDKAVCRAEVHDAPPPPTPHPRRDRLG